MTLQDLNKQIALELVDTIFNRKRLDRIDQFYAQNLVDHSLPEGLPPGIEGKKAHIAAFIKAFPDIEVHYRYQIAEHDIVAGYYTMTGTHQGSLGEIPVTGKKINISGADFLRFENGKVAEHRNVINDLDLMKQLGIIPEDYLVEKV